MTGLLPEPGLRLNPDAPHPPFTWQITLPESWAVLETQPATWSRSAERIIDEQLAGQRLRAADRREILGHLEDLVVTAQRGGVLLSLVRIGRLSAGGLASAGLQVAWYDSAPERASLATVRQAASRRGVLEEVQTQAGTVVLQRDHLLVAPPGSLERRGLTSFQGFLPLTGHTWTAVVASASAHPTMTEVLRDLVLTVAGSIGPVDEDSADPPPEPSYAPVDAPGLEKGFGTMVVRRVPPA